LNSEISKGLYVWGEFDQESAYLVESLKKKVNEKLLGPNFNVHLTLSGPVNYNESHDRKTFLNLGKRFSKLKLKLSGIGFKENYFQSLFLVVENSDELNSLKKSIDAETGVASREYFPHISLFYGSANEDLKKNLCKELVIPNQIYLEKISLVKIHKNIEQWETFKTFYLKK
tara:strand:- start:419 stop:934 length:516 start_codon:yes stop_codon:yes gene_type:complete